MPKRTGPEVRRAQAVMLVNDEVSEAVIWSIARVSRRQAFDLRKRFFKDGVAVFKDHRTSNRDRVLTAAEKKQVISTLKTKKPADVISACEVKYWTTGLLGLYIKHQFNKEYKSKTSERLLFREANLTFHMPGRRYENADPEMQAAWIKQTTPILKKHWKAKDTIILCEDEMVLTSKTTTQKVWLPKGQYPPVIETNSTRKRKNFYGFLDLKTGKQHAYITDKQNMFETVKVLKKIRKAYPNKKIVLLWDNCGWHKGSEVMSWVEQDTNLEIIWFPSYAPELNPQEHVWKAGRQAVTHNQHITKIEEIAEQFKDYITKQTFDYGLLGLRPSSAQA